MKNLIKSILTLDLSSVFYRILFKLWKGYKKLFKRESKDLRKVLSQEEIDSLIEDVRARSNESIDWVTVMKVTTGEALRPHRYSPSFLSQQYHKLSEKYSSSVIALDYAQKPVINKKNGNIRLMARENSNEYEVQILVKNPDTFRILYGH